MKKMLQAAVVSLLLFTVVASFNTAAAQGTAFTYQGRLNSGGGPASGGYDLTFTLYTTNATGIPIAGPVTNSATTVTNGLFTTLVDFGPGIFTGTSNWLEIAVRTNGGGSFATLAPRQRITPTPYALLAGGASSLLGPLATTQLSGTIPSAAISGAYGSAVSFNNGADSFDGTFNGQFFGSQFTGGFFTGQFFGNGSGLTGFTDAQLPANVAFLNSNQVFSAQNAFVQGIGIGTYPASYLVLDALAPGAGARFTSTGDYFGSVIELNNAAPIYNGCYLGAINFNNSSNTYPGQIAYVLGNVTNEGYDYMEFNVGGSVGLQIQADPTFYGGNNIIGGYGGNTIGGAQANGVTISGGGEYTLPNTVLGTNATFATIGGGVVNTINGSNVYHSVISGGSFNTISGGNAMRSVIAGGGNNTVQGSASAIGGGYYNTIAPSNTMAVIGGGQNNFMDVYGFANTLGGGIGNWMQGNYFYYTNNIPSASTIAGGEYNTILTNAIAGTIGGGYQNIIQTNSYSATIGGGSFNQAGGNNGTVPGGFRNVATGDGSFAAGINALATNNGAFVLADDEHTNFSSTASNQLSARFTGGIVLVTGGAGLTLDGKSVLAGSNGGSLTNVNATTLNGLSAANYAPAAGSANYIQNQSALQQPAALNISGAMAAGSFAVGGGGTASGTVAVNALIVTNSVRVPGAGIGTTTAVFVQRATAANIDSNGVHRTTISNPLCDGDPNAILIITHNYNPGNTGSILDTNACSVYYNPTLLKWQIYHDNLIAMTVNDSWNVLIVKP